MDDQPPYLTVGTEVSAKYKGAFCEAKIRKVTRVVKCRVVFKGGLGSVLLSDELIKGTLRVGATVEAKHADKNQYIEATIAKIQDCSQYTVVFDDGDITTLRRSALCLKSGRHFNESETLDQLPLTHPEHFSNPVVGGSGRRGIRRRAPNDDKEESSDDEEGALQKGRKKPDSVFEFGKVVCVEMSEKKKGRDPWFPGLVVSGAAQEQVKIRKDECLVRNFRDGRYYTVPKKETTEFIREQHGRLESGSVGLKAAVEKALSYLEKDELPPHWDREQLFGSPAEEEEEDSDSESTDDVQREKKDNFVAQLYKFMEERGSPINKAPIICNRDLDLHKLYAIVVDKGGYSKVTNGGQWKHITARLGFGSMPSTSTINLVKQGYKKYLLHFEEFNKKLGYNIHITAPSKPRNSRSVYRQNIVPVSKKDKEKEKDKEEESIPTPPAPECLINEEKEKEKPTECEEESSSITDIEKKKGEEESWRSRIRPESSRPRKEKEKGEEDSSGSSPDKESRKRGKSTKDVKERGRSTSLSPVKRQESDGSIAISVSTVGKEVLVAEPVSPSPSSQGSRKGRGSQRKKKDTPEEEPPALLPEKIPDVVAKDSVSKDTKIKVGDKVSVHYPNGDKYPAKVVNIDDKEETYLVHYFGWNTRYDEWIRRDRIVENLSLKENYEMKRGAHPPNQGLSGANSANRPEGMAKDKARDDSKGKKRGRSRSITPAPAPGGGPTVAGNASGKTPPAPIAGTRSKLAATSNAVSISSTPGSKKPRLSMDAEKDDAEIKKTLAKKDSLPSTDLDKTQEELKPMAMGSRPPSSSTTSCPYTDKDKTKEKRHHHHHIRHDGKTKRDERRKEGHAHRDKGDQDSHLEGKNTDKKGSKPNAPKTSSTAPQKSLSPPDIADQKLDIYEFEEDSSEAPKLKMFSPRSPDKKEEKDKEKDNKMEKEKDADKQKTSLPLPNSTGAMAPSIASGKQQVTMGSIPPPHHPIISSHPSPLSVTSKTPAMSKAVKVSIERMPASVPTASQNQMPPSLNVLSQKSGIGGTPTTTYSSTHQSSLPISTASKAMPYTASGSVVSSPHTSAGVTGMPSAGPTVPTVAASVKGAATPNQSHRGVPITPSTAAVSSISMTTPVMSSTSGTLSQSSMLTSSGIPVVNKEPRPISASIKPDLFPHLLQQHKTMEATTSASSSPFASFMDDKKSKRRSPSKIPDVMLGKEVKEKRKEKVKPDEKYLKGSPAKKRRAESPPKPSSFPFQTSATHSPPKKVPKVNVSLKPIAPFPPIPLSPSTPAFHTPPASSVPSPIPPAHLTTPSLLSSTSSVAISKINETISNLMQTTPGPDKERDLFRALSQRVSMTQLSPSFSAAQDLSRLREKPLEKSEPKIGGGKLFKDLSSRAPTDPSKRVQQAPPAPESSSFKETQHFTSDRGRMLFGSESKSKREDDAKLQPSLSYSQMSSSPSPTATGKAKTGGGSAPFPPMFQRHQEAIQTQKTLTQTDVYTPSSASSSTSLKRVDEGKEQLSQSMEKDEKFGLSIAQKEPRPLTPSFLHSEEVLLSDDDGEDDIYRKDKKSRSDKRKEMYTDTSKTISLGTKVKIEEESCSSLLCEEEIPGSPAPMSSQGSGRGSKFDFSGISDQDDRDDSKLLLGLGAGNHRPTLLPKKSDKPRLVVERSQSLVVMHDTTPPSTPDSPSFSTDTGSPHVDSGRISPPGEGGSSKSKDGDSSDDGESGDNMKGYYSGSPTKRSSKDSFLSPLSKSPIIRARTSTTPLSPAKKRRMIRRKSPTDDYARQFGYRGIRSSSGRRIQSSIDVHEAIKGPPPPPVNLAKRPVSEKFNALYADLDAITDPEERISLAMKSLEDIREEWLKVKGRLQTRERKERKKKRRTREKAAAERQARVEAAKILASQTQVTPTKDEK